MNTETQSEFDVIVIGAGPAGEVVAGRLGEAGYAVAVIEDELVGGECSFYACMPSKALLRPAQALAEVRRVPGAAEAVTGGVDVAATLARRDHVIHNLDDSQAVAWLDARGILGGGVVGVELAQAYSGLGARVTVIEGAERLLAQEEPFVSQQLSDALHHDGVEVRVAVTVRAVRRRGEIVVVELDDGETIEADEIVVAVGRRPLTDDLGLPVVWLLASCSPSLRWRRSASRCRAPTIAS